VTVRVAEKDLPAAREILGINSGITTETIPARVAGEVPAEPGQAAEALPPPLLGSPVFERSDWLSFAITTVLALAIYLFTLAPEVTLEMSGELATAAVYGGVAHPPGFPVWTLYAWLFTKLLPWSNIAWRIGVSSAVAAALTCGVVALMVSRVGAIMLEGMKGFRRLDATEERLL